MNDHDPCPMWSIETGDPEMNEAIRSARETLPIFFTALADPAPHQTSFLLKVRFAEGDRSEHIWLADLDLTVNPGIGTVANETSFPGLTFMQRAPFMPDQITDWMFFEDGQLVGAYTTRLLIQRMKPQ